MEETDLDAMAGMSLQGLPPKQAVHIFLSRRCGRSVKKKVGEEYWYLTRNCGEGYVSVLHAPVWSTCVYEGECCGSETEAEASAASNFLQDEAVLPAAACLPLRRRERDALGEVLQSAHGQTKSQIAEQCKQKALATYTDYCECSCWRTPKPLNP